MDFRVLETPYGYLYGLSWGGGGEEEEEERSVGRSREVWREVQMSFRLLLEAV